MNANKVIVGEFENESYAILAKKYLGKAGIKANILKEGNMMLPPLLSQDEGVRLTVYEAQLERAKKILEINFI